MSRGSRTAVAVIGAGRLGTALVRALAGAGYVPITVSSRSYRSAARASRGLASVHVVRDPVQAASSSRIVLLAVPDREIAGVARRLAREPGVRWRGRVVLHHAGVLGPEPLAPLERAGAATGVLHPLLALGGGARGASLMNEAGGWARIEGATAAVRAARRLARDLGLVPLRFRRPLGATERAAYHAAASVASNDLVALLALAADVLESTGVVRRDAVAALAALARSAVARIEAEGLERGATGPVVRGDAATLRAHLAALERASRPASAAHRLLSRRLLATADLDPARRRAVARALAAGRSRRRTV